jgi:16S rRNA (adenine1518-N6/adenine1519-N6)-dimethyltransferase
MLQKEFAQRLSAEAGSRDYGRLSVLLQSFCVIENKILVGSDSFFPRPSVDSLVFTLTPRPIPLVPLADYPWFNQVVKAAFANRRKTLLNSLSASLPMEKTKVSQALQQAEIDPGCRAEVLGIARLADMARELNKIR